MHSQKSNLAHDDVTFFGTRRGLGRVIGGLAALGVMTAAGSQDEAAGKRKKKRSQTARPVPAGPSGPVGPSGPAGPEGPTGPAGTPVTFVSITGENSAALPAAVGGEVQAVAECGLNSVPVSCGWSYVGDAADFDHSITQIEPGFLRGVGMCTVRMRRTATVGSAGGKVFATAICTR